MRDRDSHDAVTTMLAVVADAIAIWLAQMLAVWMRFDSGWFAANSFQWIVPSDVMHEPGLYSKYAMASAVTIAVYVAVFQILKLYTRPQDGSFTGKVPRLVRASLLGGGGVLILSGLLKNTIPYSNLAIIISLFTVTFIVLLERFAMFRLEFAMARHAKPCHRALILGANEDAAKFIDAVKREPRMRTEIVAIMPIAGEEKSNAIPDSLKFGDLDNLETVVKEHSVNMLVLASHSLSHDQTVQLVVFCEQHLVRFSMIPDLFRMMTSRMEFQMIDNVPLVGVGRWPLDQVWNRVVKRVIDIIGGLIGLVIAAPFIAIFAVIIKLESKGPVFYGQERCGRRGQTFMIYKLRTMREDAESANKPGWTVDEDPRRTKSGAFMRRWNIDELPQFWNVLRGEMSLVGPRPERPYFVEQFTPGIEHYMWRHVSKPGLTGWAQVNGFRGDTSISERVKYDLYYLENWSLAFDFKILVRTLFTYRNAC